MHIPSPFQRHNQRGDTIVEVLIALAIISSVLAGAFFVTNRSSQNVRDTEEHSQALQLLQGQIEQVRALASDPATSASTLSSYFCFDTDGTLVTLASATTFGCDVSLDGSGTGEAYKFVIQKGTYTAGSTTTFNATVQWNGLLSPTNSEQLLYKVELAP